MWMQHLSPHSSLSTARGVSNSCVTRSIIADFLRATASLKALRIINDAEDVDARSLDDMPEDSMNEHQLREALRRARRVRLRPCVFLSRYIDYVAARRKRS